MITLRNKLIACIAPDNYEEIANIAWGLDSRTAQRYTSSETVGSASWGAVSASVPLYNEFADLQISRHVRDIVDDHYKKHGYERAPIAVAKFAVSMHSHNPALSKLLLQTILDRESDNYSTILHRAKGHYLQKYPFAWKSHAMVGCTAGLIIGLAIGDIWYHIRSGDGSSILYGAYRCHAVPTFAGITLGCVWGKYKKQEACKAIELLEGFERLKPLTV